MIPILYSKTDNDYTKNGVGFLTDTISCDVTEERNGAFECVLTYPITGQHYADITEGAVIKAKPNDTSNPQLFRIYSHSKPINGIVTFAAEHISYDLNGIPLASLSLRSTTAQSAIAAAISAGAFDSGYTATSDITTINSIDIKTPRSIRAALGGQEGSVLDVWGGEFEFDNKQIKLHAHRGSDTGVSIVYGKNLTDVRQERNITETYTHIMPYATYTEETEEGDETTQTDIVVTLTEKVLAISGAENVGHQKALVINLSEMFADDETITETALRAKANQYISAHPALGTPRISIAASFVALWQTEEYKDIAPLERVRLCDIVTIRFDKLGISAKAKVVKTVYDALAERYKSVELGEARSNFADTVLAQNGAITELSKAVRKGFSIATQQMQKAIADATAAITGNSGGYVVLYPEEHPQEILILDAPTLEEAVHVWRWNSSGLGYSSTGYNGTYGLAMTMNGAIVADYITAGNLNGALITAGTVSSNAISAGFKNEIATSINAAKETVEQEFKVADETLMSRIATSTSKYNTAGETIDFYGYGEPKIPASSSNNGRKYLDQETGYIYTSNGSSWTKSSSPLNLITTNLQSQITQNANSISLKVAKGDVVSEINQSSDIISLTAGRLIITSGNFKLDSLGSVTATNVNLSGSIKTERSDGYYTHIHDGIIEMFLSNKRIAYMMPVGSDLTQFAILGSGNYDGIAIGAAFNDSIETYYRCNIQNAASSEGCRHHFIGSVKFDDTVNFDDTTKFSGKATFDAGIRSNANIDFKNGYGISLGGDIAFRWATKAEQGVERDALWVGMQNYNTAITGARVYIYGDPRIIGELRFLDTSSNNYYTAMWHDSLNAAFNVGSNSQKLFLKGSAIYANNSPIATSSDERVKRNIADLDDRYLKLIKNINPVSFKYIEDLSNSNRTHTGFIAQGVLTAMNDAGISSEEFAAFVDLKGNGSEYALRYEEFIPLVLAYVKDLDGRIGILESKERFYNG